MFLTKAADRTIHALFMPIAWLLTGTWSKKAVASTIFDPNGLDPTKRYYALACTSAIIGSGIPAATGLMSIIALKTQNLGFGAQVATPFWIFFLGGFLAIGFRAIEASHELKNWRTLKRSDRLGEYEPGYHARAAVPRSADLIIPVVLALILSPIAIPFVGMAS